MKKINLAPKAPRSLDELKKIAATLTVELGKSQLEVMKLANTMPDLASVVFFADSGSSEEIDAIFNLGNAKYQLAVYEKDVASYTRLLENINKKAAKLIAQANKESK